MRVGRVVMTCGWLVLAAAASGCASIVEGTDQSLTVQTTPSGAGCELKRDGSVIGVRGYVAKSTQDDPWSGE